MYTQPTNQRLINQIEHTTIQSKNNQPINQPIQADQRKLKKFERPFLWNLIWEWFRPSTQYSNFAEFDGYFQS